MSIFDPTSGKDSTSWLKEKSLMALKSAASLIDLANEPDTNAWYARNLKDIGRGLLARLIPMAALFHGSGENSVKIEEWQSILDKGTFALAKWCQKWHIANPYSFDGLMARQRDTSEAEEKSQGVPADVASGDSPDGTALKLLIYKHMALQMLHEDLREPAKRLLSWALFHLYTSSYADIVVLDKAFLPTDTGLTPDETSQGYQLLYQSGLTA